MSLKRVLVTGADGQIGRSLRDLASQSSACHYVFASRQKLDISAACQIDAVLDADCFDVLINAAAYTAVDQAPEHKQRVLDTNARGPGLLAQACARRGIALLHISTDYVFAGNQDGAYVEDAVCQPINFYGHSKMAGELAVLQANQQAMILRTSWVFSAYGNNFVKTMLGLAAGAELRVVNDQIGGPSWAGHVARALHFMALNCGAIEGGVYHFGGWPCVSRYDFAQEILLLAYECGLIPALPRLLPVSSQSWPAAQARPANSCLANTKLYALTSALANDWRAGLRQTLSALAHGPC